MNAVSFAVEASIYPGRTPALAFASAKVSAVFSDNPNTSNTLVHLFRLNGIAIHVDPNLGGYRLVYPRYRLASGASQFAMLLPRTLERAIEDAVFARFPGWLAEQEEHAKQAGNAEQTGGAR